MVESAWKTLEVTASWVRFADSKAAAILAGSGVLAGFSIQRMAGVLRPTVRWAELAFLGAALVALAGAALLALLALLPRASGEGPPSVIFFADVARVYGQRYAEFATDLEALCSDDRALSREIAGQVLSLSRVAARKYRYTSLATRLLAAGLVAVAIAALLAAL